MAEPTSDIGLYRDAAVYDVLHAPGTADELDGLERLALRHLRDHAARLPWLEPACGTGRLVRRAAARGTRAFGFDADPGMVDYANRRIASAGLRSIAVVFTADMRTFADTPGDRTIAHDSIGFAFNTINTFRHLMSDRDALDHLDQIDRVLAPGGVYAVGLSTSAYGCECPTEDVWTGARGPLRVTQTVQYIPPAGPNGGARIERVHSHLTINRPAGDEHRDSTYALRTYALSQWFDLIARSPFVIHDTTDDAGQPCEPGPSGYRIYVLARRDER